MNIIKKPSWQIGENEITDEILFHNRRHFLKLGAAAFVSTGMIAQKLSALEKEYRIPLQFSKTAYGEGLELNSFEQASTYNNFYEFSTSKEKPAKMAHTLITSPWDVGFYGECENDTILGVEDILKQVTLEERIYRFRCVEGWSMVVPWIGFPLKKLLDIAKPKSSAKFVAFKTKYDPQMFSDQGRGIFGAIPYPYVEGLRMDEAINELAFVAVGMYGKVLPKQNGAPLRLIVPWKYGFKSIKSIDYVEFTKNEPKNTWQAVNAREYGFYANVNPQVDHPRWSQAKERKLGSFLKTKTLPFNGYEKEVAYMYKDMDLKRYF
ncbi:MAG: protein-methionine-sulfoxide reductase catalytic subunit MsrP [Sulfurospirillum sp.]|nr:protein-methionine-sulfoxide reductase catalytic subunit MsrP [Sulfurospirillum sp.]